MKNYETIYQMQNDLIISKHFNGFGEARNLFDEALTALRTLAKHLVDNQEDYGNEEEEVTEPEHDDWLEIQIQR